MLLLCAVTLIHDLWLLISQNCVRVTAVRTLWKDDWEQVHNEDANILANTNNKDVVREPGSVWGYH